MKPLTVHMETFGCFNVRIRDKTVVVHIWIPEVKKSLYCCQFRDEKIRLLAYAFNHIEDEGKFWITCSLGHFFELEVDDNDGFWMQVENVSVWLDELDLDDLREKVNRFAKELEIPEKEVVE